MQDNVDALTLADEEVSKLLDILEEVRHPTSRVSDLTFVPGFDQMERSADRGDTVLESADGRVNKRHTVVIISGLFSFPDTLNSLILPYICMCDIVYTRPYGFHEFR